GHLSGHRDDCGAREGRVAAVRGGPRTGAADGLADPGMREVVVVGSAREADRVARVAGLFRDRAAVGHRNAISWNRALGGRDHRAGCTGPSGPPDQREHHERSEDSEPYSCTAPARTLADVL